MAILAHWLHDVTDEAGDLLPSVQVRIERESDAGLPQVYDGKDTTTAGTLGNPFTVSDGRIDAYVPPENYKVTLTATGHSPRVLRNVAVGAGGVFTPTGKLTATTILGALAQLDGFTRDKLTANRTYYVRTDGSDSNNGLTNTSGGAFLTIQKAVDAVSTLDLSIYNVIIQVADGTYTGAVVCNGPWLGSGTVTLQGNSGTPANVLISVTSSDAITVKNNSALIVKDLKLSTTTSGLALFAAFGGFIEYSNLDFGACASVQVRASEAGIIQAAGNYVITGGGVAHWNATGAGAAIRCQFRTITITGTPAFSSSFAGANLDGTLIVNGNTFSGSATGTRYSAANMGTVYVAGGGASYLPGNAAGTGTVPDTSPYGLYV